MTSHARKTQVLEMPEIYTVSQIAKRLGLTRQSVAIRIKVLKEAGFESEYGVFLKRGNGYLLTKKQAELVSMGTGRGVEAHRFWERHRAMAAATGRSRRRVS